MRASLLLLPGPQYFDPRFKRMVTWKPPEEEKFENRHYRSGNISGGEAARPVKMLAGAATF